MPQLDPGCGRIANQVGTLGDHGTERDEPADAGYTKHDDNTE
jgi:hypothetical protein